jgi:ankyrin repeat protein
MEPLEFGENEHLPSDFNRKRNAQDNNGFTPLHIAASNNQAAITPCVLLAKGASTTIVDNNDNTTRKIASYLGYNDILVLCP